MIKSLKIYISSSFDVYENLATEKLLLDSVDKDCLILYLWQNENTVVIGQNQNPWAECNCVLLQNEGGTLARRLSGGGAVFHDRGNLNFTFVCTRENYDLPRQMRVLQSACALAGIETNLSGRNDILANGRKFSGNAFYNSNGKSYHHGTIMISSDLEKMAQFLTPSEAKLSAKGVKSVRSRVINLSEIVPHLSCEEMKSHMITAFQGVYGLSATHLSINGDEILPLKKEYSSHDYLFKKTPPFTVSFEGKFSWGEIQIGLEIKKGIIENAHIYTDAMDHTLAEKIKTALTGCSFNKKEIENALPGEIKKDILSLFK